MAINQHNVSRRRALAGIGIAAVVPVVASPAMALTAQPGRSAWNAALTRLKVACENIDRIGDVVTAAHDSAEAACPRRSEFFSRYNMGHGWDRDRNFRAAQTSLVIERAKGERLSPEEAKRATDDALRLVDEFDAYSGKHNEAFAEYDRQQERFDGAADEGAKAFHALIETARPCFARSKYWPRG